jgi:hypothetical protein
MLKWVKDGRTALPLSILICCTYVIAEAESVVESECNDTSLLRNERYTCVKESVQQLGGKGGFDVYNHAGKSVASQMACMCAQSGWATVVCIGTSIALSSLSNSWTYALRSASR